MGTVELLLLILLALFYLAVPVITLLMVIRINNRLNEIEKVIKTQQ